MQETNLFWRAKWIWDAYHQYTSNCYAYFNKCFHLKSVNEIESIRIYCTCSSEYKLYINSTYIGRGSLASQLEYQYYDVYHFGGSNVKELLKDSNNITAICYNYGVGMHYRPASQAGFLLQMEVLYTNGNIDSIITDNTWGIMMPLWWRQESSQMFWTIGFQEIIDLNMCSNSRFLCEVGTIIGDNTSKASDPSFYREENWENAVEIGAPPVSPWLNLIPRDIPHLLEVERDPINVIEYGGCRTNYNDYNYFNIADIITKEEHVPLMNCKIKFAGDENSQNIKDITVEGNCSEYSVYIVFDFGSEVVGYPIMEFESDGNGVIDIGYSECLDGRGRVNPTRQEIRQADRIIISNGIYSWEMFNRRAFRYLQITVRGINKRLLIKRVYIKALQYPFDRNGYFRCSNDVVNRIYEISKYTLDACMKENYEDCPLREHAQYIGDMRVEALMNYYAFGDTKLISKGLRQFAREQQEDGWFKALCPGSTVHNIVDYLPIWVMTIWDYYMFTGDISLAKELYGNLTKLMRWLKSQTNELGLLERKPGWWIFIDWADIGKDGIVTGLQCFYFKALMDAAKIAGILHDTEQKKVYLQEAIKVRESINSLLWDNKKGAFVDCLTNNPSVGHKFSIQTNSLAVIFNIADKSRRKRVAEFLTDKENPKVRTGYFKHYELEALFNLNIQKEFTEGFDYWEGMLKRGASTWWEVFDPDMGEEEISENSLCHGWSSTPLFQLPSKILGIVPVKPGFDSFIIKPNLFNFEWVEGSVPTVKGDIRVEIRKNGRSMNMNCEIPEDIIAQVIIPVQTDDEIIRIVLNGTITEARVLNGKFAYLRLDKGGRNEILINNCLY